jgi:twitching motility protein PilI
MVRLATSTTGDANAATRAPQSRGGAGPLDELIAKLEIDFRAAAPIAMTAPDRAERVRLAARQTKCLLVRVADNLLALRMENVVEILTAPAVTPIPNTPAWVIGVTNLRGDVVSVCDLRTLLGFEPTAATTRERVVVVRSLSDDTTTSFVVDRVEGIRNLLIEAAASRHIDLPEGLAPFVAGTIEYERNLFLVADLERLLASPTLRQFEPM